PRGAQALLLAAKVNALRDARFHVAYTDIKAVALPALRHRVILNFEAEADRVSHDALVKDIIERTPTEPVAMEVLKPPSRLREGPGEGLTESPPTCGRRRGAVKR